MRVVAAPDKFKGTIDAVDAANAIARGCEQSGATCDVVPMADGGEGTLAALGGPNRTSVVTGPLGEPVEAAWRLSKGTAVIEMAQAAGLVLAGGADENQPMDASTVGVGELMALAADAGAKEIVVCVGGSATTDGGLGALKALHPAHRLRGIDIVVACDVRTRFVDAAERFAPQKGASESQVKLLRRRLERLVDVYVHDYGVDVSELEGGGAAGGLAGGLAAVSARLVPGFDVVAEANDLESHIEGADLVITGEGFMDAESFDGKVVGGVAEMAAELGVRTLALAGDVSDEVGPLLPEGLEVCSLSDEFGRERSMNDTAACITDAVVAHLARADAQG